MVNNGSASTKTLNDFFYIYQFEKGLITQEDGFCFRIDLESRVNFELNRESDIFLLIENNKVISSTFSQHQEIRSLGMGRFDFWGSDVLFSASDNSSPLISNNLYSIAIMRSEVKNLIKERILDIAASSNEDILSLLDKNSNTNNSFFNNFFKSANTFLELIKEIAFDLKGKTVAVAGCGEMPFVPLRILFEGADKVIANDILPIKKTFDKDYLSTLMEIVKIYNPKLLENFGTSLSHSDNEYKFDSINVLDQTPFEKIALEPSSLDLVVSNSVLEHVMNVEDFYNKHFQLLKNGGYGIHIVDLRDHLYFFDPTRFLYMTSTEYAPINTENRLRASQHLKLIIGAGFELLKVRVKTLDDKSFEIDPGEIINNDVDFEKIHGVSPSVTHNERLKMAEPFNSMSLFDLSIIGLTVVIKKHG